ncbi:MAG: DNA primase small subunit domain-containing protein [archaeon]
MAGEDAFLRKHFQGFYSGHEIAGPPELESREFGYGVFGRKIANRNIAFSSRKEFNNFLRNQVPFFVSYSSALYKFPSGRPMDAKGLFAADLVYEFDADDLPTECKQRHDSWQCPKCGRKGNGRQLQCDECGTPTRLEEWFCPECLGVARDKVFSLLEFLENDFGFSDGIAINFSGRAGYHVHVRSDSVRQLPNTARVELIDYLTATGLNIFSHFEKKETFFTFKGNLNEKISWPSRIVLELIDLLEEGNAEKLALMANISLPMAKVVLKKSPIILKAVRERNAIPSIFGKVSSTKQTKGDEIWQNLLNKIVARIAPIDRQTSVDLNKIVRVPETLHGETGLVSRELSKEALRSFNPFDDAIAFSGDETVRVFISKAPSFYLSGQRFGPFEGQEAELPLFAAVFLLARGAALLLLPGAKNEA